MNRRDLLKKAAVQNLLFCVRLLALLVLGAEAVARGQSGPIVNTQYGPVLGNDRGAWNEWLGIPFAAPPGRFPLAVGCEWSYCCSSSRG